MVEPRAFIKPVAVSQSMTRMNRGWGCAMLDL
jgi:hypothetical protein